MTCKNVMLVFTLVFAVHSSAFGQADNANLSATQLYGLGTLYYHSDDYQKAESSLDAAAKKNPGDPRIVYFAGLTQWRVGKDEAADALFEKAAKLEARDTSNRYLINKALLRVQGNVRAKIEVMRKDAKIQHKIDLTKARNAHYTENQLRQKDVLARPTISKALEATLDPFADQPGDTLVPPPAFGSAPKVTLPPRPEPTPEPDTTPDPFKPTPTPDPKPVVPTPTPDPVPDVDPFAVALGPVETFMKFHELEQGKSVEKIGEIWGMLPATYQAEIDGLVHEFANKMDKDLWNQSFLVLAKVATIIKDKKEFIIGQENVVGALQGAGPVVDQTKLPVALDSLSEALTILATSEISDLEKLKTIKMGDFFKGSLTKFVGKLAALATDVSPLAKAQLGAPLSKITLVESDDTTATVKVEDTGQEIDLILIEGKWVPAELAGFPMGIAMAKAALAENLSPEKVTQMKVTATPFVAMANAMLDQFLLADSQESFDTVLKAIGAEIPPGTIEGIMGSFGGGAGPGGPALEVQPLDIPKQ